MVGIIPLTSTEDCVASAYSFSFYSGIQVLMGMCSVLDSQGVHKCAAMVFGQQAGGAGLLETAL